MKVLRNDEKVFAGKGLQFVAVWKKGDNKTVYNMIYEDGPGGTAMIKRFCVDAITHDKEYDLTKGTKGSKLIFFQTQNNAEDPLNIKVVHREKKGLRKKEFEFSFNELLVKGRSASGNILTKHPIKKIKIIESKPPEN